MALKGSLKDMTASRVSVELIIHLFPFGLSQGLRLEDGTYSSTLYTLINMLFEGLNGQAKNRKE